MADRPKSGICPKHKVKDVAYGTEFYSFDDANGVWSRDVDDKLTLLENHTAPAYKALVVGKRDFNKDPSLKKVLAFLIAATLLRTPDQQQKSTEDHQRLKRVFDKLPKSSSGKPQLTWAFTGLLYVPVDTSDYHEWNRNDQNTRKQLFGEKLRALAGSFAEKLFNKCWHVFTTDQPGLITTDVPVVKLDDDGSPSGIDVPGTTIYFPLSSSQMLTMTDPKPGEVGTYHSLPFSKAEMFNVVMRVNSADFLFSQSELQPRDLALLNNYAPSTADKVLHRN